MPKNTNTPEDSSRQSEANDALILVRMTHSQREEVRALAARLGWSASQLGRICILGSIELHKAGAPLSAVPEENLLHAPSMPVEISC